MARISALIIGLLDASPNNFIIELIIDHSYLFIELYEDVTPTNCVRGEQQHPKGDNCHLIYFHKNIKDMRLFLVLKEKIIIFIFA